MKFFLLFVLVSLATRAIFLPIEILDIDESSHVLGSWQLMNGKLLYTDFVNNKPPLLYVYYAIPQFLLGKGLFAVRLFTILFTIPLTALAAAAFYEYRRTGLIAGLVYLVYSAAFLAHDMHAANTEILMMLPGSWALVFINREEKALRMFPIATASFLIGIAVLFKYQIASWGPLIALAAAYACARAGNLRRVPLLWTASLASFALPVAATYLIFARLGGADMLVYWTIQNNLGYSANPIQAREAIGRAASYMLPFLLATAPLWWATIRFARSSENKYRRYLLLLLVLASIPPALVGFRFYPHYFIQLYVPLALASAPFLTAAFEQKGSPITKWFVRLSLFLLAGFTIANIYVYYFRNDVYRETDPVFRRVAARLKSDDCYNGASMFVWGYAHPFYYYSRIPPATRFVVLPQSGLTAYISGNLQSVQQNPESDRIKQEHWKWLMRDLERNHVTYIIDTAPAAIYRWNRYPVSDYPLLRDYLSTHFRLLDTIDAVPIYKRIGCRGLLESPSTTESRRW